MPRFVSIVLVCLLLLSPTGFAQEYTRYRLPQGRRITVSGQTYQAFDLGEYQTLLHIDNDLRHFEELNTVNTARIAEITAALDNVRIANSVCAERASLLDTERQRVYQLWVDENRLRHEAENRPSWDWIPWLIAGGLAISTVVLGIVVGVQ